MNRFTERREMPMKNYYEILELAVDADPGMIKSAFKRLAKRCHPDISGDCGDQFKKLKQAFDTLSDPGKRRSYDSRIGVNNRANRSYDDGRIRVPKVSRDVFDDIVDVFSDRFGLSRKQELTFELYLSNYEFEHGTSTMITIPQEKICPSCFGFGGTLLQKCLACEGSGLVSYGVDFDLVLDPPLEPNQVYKIKRGNYDLRFVLRKR